MFKAAALRRVLIFYLSKPAPATIPLSGEESKENDYVVVSYRDVVDDLPDTLCLLKALAEDAAILTYRQRAADDAPANPSVQIEVTVPLRRLLTARVNVRYFAKSWTLRYEDVWSPVLDVLGGVRLRWYFQRRYDRGLDTTLKQDRVLRRVVERYQSSDEIFPTVAVSDLLVDLFGPRIENSEQAVLARRNLQMILSALAANGDVSLGRDDDIDPRLVSEVVPRGQALATLSKVEIEMSRHRDIVRLGRWQMWGTIAIAVLTGFLAIPQIKELWLLVTSLR